MRAIKGQFRLILSHQGAYLVSYVWWKRCPACLVRGTCVWTGWLIQLSTVMNEKQSFIIEDLDDHHLVIKADEEYRVRQDLEIEVNSRHVELTTSNDSAAREKNTYSLDWSEFDQDHVLRAATDIYNLNTQEVTRFESISCRKQNTGRKDFALVDPFIYSDTFLALPPRSLCSGHLGFYHPNRTKVLLCCMISGISKSRAIQCGR